MDTHQLNDSQLGVVHGEVFPCPAHGAGDTAVAIDHDEHAIVDRTVGEAFFEKLGACNGHMTEKN